MEQEKRKLIARASAILLCMCIAAFAAETAVPQSGALEQAVAQPDAVKTPSLIDMFHNPAPWLEMGADARFREHAGYNWIGLSSRDKFHDSSNHDWHWERYRLRWWTKTKLDKNTDINMRMTWEFRTYDKPSSQKQSTDFDEIIIDNLNLTMRQFLGLPATVVLGRQDIKLGEGWLVTDGTPVDGSRTLYFDAIRVTYDLREKTKLDLIYIDQHPNSDWLLKPINDRNKYITQQEEHGAIVYLTDKTFGDTQLEGYFMYKNDNPVDGPARNFSSTDISKFSRKADIFTLGGAVSGPISSHWNYRVEGAFQTGSSTSPANRTDIDDTEQLRAFGQKSDLEYSFKDSLNNRLHVTYEYLSGDDPGTKRVESFNPLWGEWPYWSEMYQPYITKLEDGQISNLHRVAFGHKIKPNSKWEILTDYHLLWADQNTFRGNAQFTNNGNFRGQLITCRAVYNFTKNIKGNIVGEYFMPGNYYASGNRDNALYFHFTIEYLF
jgi:hypothetical protein